MEQNICINSTGLVLCLMVNNRQRARPREMQLVSPTPGQLKTDHVSAFSAFGPFIGPFCVSLMAVLPYQRLIVLMLTSPTGKNSKFYLFCPEKKKHRQTTAYRCLWQTGEFSTQVSSNCHFKSFRLSPEASEEASRNTEKRTSDKTVSYH